MNRLCAMLLLVACAATAGADRPLPVTDEIAVPMPAATVTATPVGATPVGATPPPTDMSIQPVEVDPPVAFEAVYEARVSIGRGEAIMQVRPLDDGRYLFHSRTEPKGLASLVRRKPFIECTIFEVLPDGRWRGDRYAFRDGDKDADIQFDWAANTATARFRDEQRLIPLTEGMTDRQLEQLLVSRRLVNDMPIDSRAVIDRGELETIDYEFLRRERIEVDAGRFATEVYRRRKQGSKRSSVIWFAPALDGLPVRIEQYRYDDRQASVELQRYRVLTTDQARGTVTPVCP